MTKLLFIQPNKLVPTRIFNDSLSGVQAEQTEGFTRAIPSIPAMTILGALNEYEVSFIDATADSPKRSWSFNNYLTAIGLNEKEMSERISDKKPDFVLISSMFTSEYMSANRLADIARRVRIPVIMGGHQVTLRPEWHTDHADLLVMGEGEPIIGEVIRTFSQRKSNRVITSRINSLDSPWEIRSVLFNSGINRYPLNVTTRNPSIYLPKGTQFRGTGVLYFSRGCPYACEYCNATERDGKRIRHMSLESAIQITEQYLDLGINVFHNEADTFGMHPLDREYLRWITEQRKNGKEINLMNTNSFFTRYFFPNSRFDPNRVDLLKDSGFQTITVSIESFNERFNRGKLRGITREMLKECFGYMKSIGLKIDAYMIYLFPGQTEEELRTDIKNIEYLQEDITTATWRSLSYFPGTEYYNWAIAARKFTEEQYRVLIEQGDSFYDPDKKLNFSKIRRIPQLH